MLQLKAISYEDARLAYFRNEVKRLKRKLDYWSRYSTAQKHTSLEVEDNLSEIGAAIAYNEDVIQMLLDRWRC